MRIPILLSIALLTVPLHAQTPFAPVGAQWSYTQGSCCGPDSTVAVFQVLSDTAVQGRTCGHVTTAEGWFGCYEVLHYFSTSDDSTYYFNEAQQQFHLLFRWNAKPGETWSTPISQAGVMDTLDWTVSDTGHVIIGGNFLRTLTVSQTSRQNALFCPLGGVITEQLGGNAPFTWVNGVCDGETYQALRCYEENIFPISEPPPPPPISWLNPQFPQCAITTGIHDETGKSAFRITPSVAGGDEPITITMQPATTTANLRVLDASGRIVLQQAFHRSMEFRLPVAGMYIVQVLGDGLSPAPQQVVVQ